MDPDKPPRPPVRASASIASISSNPGQPSAQPSTVFPHEANELYGCNSIIITASNNSTYPQQASRHGSTNAVSTSAEVQDDDDGTTPAKTNYRIMYATGSNLPSSSRSADESGQRASNTAFVADTSTNTALRNAPRTTDSSTGGERSTSVRDSSSATRAQAAPAPAAGADVPETEGESTEVTASSSQTRRRTRRKTSIMRPASKHPERVADRQMSTGLFQVPSSTSAHHNRAFSPRPPRSKSRTDHRRTKRPASSASSSSAATTTGTTIPVVTTDTEATTTRPSTTQGGVRRAPSSRVSTLPSQIRLDASSAGYRRRSSEAADIAAASAAIAIATSAAASNANLLQNGRSTHARVSRASYGGEAADHAASVPAMSKRRRRLFLHEQSKTVVMQGRKHGLTSFAMYRNHLHSLVNQLHAAEKGVIDGLHRRVDDEFPAKRFHYCIDMQNSPLLRELLTIEQYKKLPLKVFNYRDVESARAYFAKTIRPESLLRTARLYAWLVSSNNCKRVDNDEPASFNIRPYLLKHRDYGKMDKAIKLTEGNYIFSSYLDKSPPWYSLDDHEKHFRTHIYFKAFHRRPGYWHYGRIYWARYNAMTRVHAGERGSTEGGTSELDPHYDLYGPEWYRPVQEHGKRYMEALEEAFDEQQVPRLADLIRKFVRGFQNADVTEAYVKMNYMNGVRKREEDKRAARRKRRRLEPQPKPNMSIKDNGGKAENVITNADEEEDERIDPVKSRNIDFQEFLLAICNAKSIRKERSRVLRRLLCTKVVDLTDKAVYTDIRRTVARLFDMKIIPEERKNTVTSIELLKCDMKRRFYFRMKDIADSHEVTEWNDSYASNKPDGLRTFKYGIPVRDRKFKAYPAFRMMNQFKEFIKRKNYPITRLPNWESLMQFRKFFRKNFGGYRPPIQRPFW